MKIDKINVQISKKIYLGNYESKHYNLGAEVSITEGESFLKAADIIKEKLEEKLLQWEKQQKSTTSQPIIKANEGKERSVTPQITKPLTVTKNYSPKTYICPECGEQMYKKEGKEYYLCSNHWGYPSMIEKGQVRPKKFNKATVSS